MNADQKTKLLEEAALIFVQMREAPDDAALLDQRDEFLGRGPEARAAFEKVQKGWAVSGGRKTRRASTILSLFLLAGMAWYFGVKPAQDLFVADVSSGLQTQQIYLKSGDGAVLDADTALVDDSDNGVRSVRLLRGAALFDVAPDARPFVVTLGEAEIRVRGTVFETAYLRGTVAVAVAEGSVDVTINGSTVRLAAGERLDWTSDGGPIERQIALADIASWREAQLVVTDTSVAEVVEIIDRRLPGNVVIAGSDLAATRISGRFDLRNPDSALRVVAAITGARFYSGAPVASVLVRTE